jgi:hypothetical protein
MANEEHVALLKQGVDAWNAWRRGDPDVLPALSGPEHNQFHRFVAMSAGVARILLRQIRA